MPLHFRVWSPQKPTSFRKRNVCATCLNFAIVEFLSLTHILSAPRDFGHGHSTAKSIFQAYRSLGVNGKRKVFMRVDERLFYIF